MGAVSYCSLKSTGEAVREEEHVRNKDILEPVGTGGTHEDRETLFLEPFVTELDINLVQEYRN